MNCQRFRDNLHEYLDGTLASGMQTEAREHVERCRECQLALERVQSFGRNLHQALERASAHVSLDPQLRRRILDSARPQPISRLAGQSAWQWLAANPFRTLGAGAVLLGVLVLAVQLRQERAEAPAVNTTLPQFVSYAVDVPFHTDRQVGVIHAEFSDQPKPSSLPR